MFNPEKLNKRGENREAGRKESSWHVQRSHVAKPCDHKTSNNLQMRLYMCPEGTTVTGLKDGLHMAVNSGHGSTTVQPKS